MKTLCSYRTRCWNQISASKKICLKGNSEKLLNMTCLPVLALGSPHFPQQLAKGKAGKLQRQRRCCRKAALWVTLISCEQGITPEMSRNVKDLISSQSLAQNSSFSESTDQQGSSGRLSRQTDKEIQLFIPSLTSTAANNSNCRSEKFHVWALFFWSLRIIHQKDLLSDKSEYIIN